MMSKKFIKILCIILAILMALSGVAVIFSTFAYNSSASIPAGDNDMDYIIPIALAVVAAVVIVIVLLLPRLKKKDGDE